MPAMLRRLEENRAFRRMRKRLRRYGRRDRFFRRARAFVPYLGVETRSGVYFVSTRDKNVGRGLVVKGRRKEQTRLGRSLERLGEAGLDRRRGLLLDVGANIGTTAIGAALEHGFERVLAFEPEHDNFLLLRANIAANGLDDRIQAFELALSHDEGDAILDLSPRNAGRHRLVPEGAGRGGKTVRVRTARLDDVLEANGLGADDVDLLWMDVEGHEPHVLTGAPTLLARSVPTVLELSPRDLERTDGLERLVEQVQAAFTHVSDLRHDHTEPLPAGQLERLIDRYAGSSTDVLVYRRA